ncbi:acyltransferase family protein [Streptomyces albipurpureus]|uniref:Acyltransferase n=1 Tax=Streptomyces albipurpureus TaxID=2897419 RepID=A0ABT0UJM9_9ACTN|nr:acyltransferase [Streptomyces sp. CWNU-1]MCM2388457.1 acyltransferase [Streptomyces sp. CWNU-1]
MSQSDVQTPNKQIGVTTSGEAAKAEQRAPGESPPDGKSPQAKAPARLYALDGLRVVAAVAVLLFHFTGIDKATDVNWGENPRYLFPELFPFTKYGSYGVQLFFIISGFVICLSAWNRTPGQFVKARFLRLFPAYWFSVVVGVLVWRLLPDSERQLPTISDSLTNLTMFQVPMSATHVVGAYWTLWIELCFYLVFLLVLIKEINYQRVYVFAWSWLLFSVIAQQKSTGLPIMSTIAPAMSTALFVAGIAMYLIYRFGPDLKLWLLLGGSWLIMQSDLMEHAVNLRDNRDFDRSPWVVLALVTGFYLLVLAIALRKLDWVNWRWLTTAGALVYPLYLLHEELGWALIRELYGHLGAWPTLGVTVGILVALSWLVHRYVERPSVTWLKKRL